MFAYLLLYHESALSGGDPLLIDEDHRNHHPNDATTTTETTHRHSKRVAPGSHLAGKKFQTRLAEHFDARPNQIAQSGASLWRDRRTASAVAVRRPRATPPRTSALSSNSSAHQHRECCLAMWGATSHTSEITFMASHQRI
jgi:hypothetical protein